MPLEAIFQKTATELDGMLVEGMDDAIDAGLDWVVPQLRLALMLYVLGHAYLMLCGRIETKTLVTAVVRAMMVGAVLKANNYNHYVRDLFFTDIPNGIALAMNGPRITVSSAQQFDVLWSAVLHYTAFINSQATGLSHALDRGIVWALAYANLAALLVCFVMWYISRAFLAIVICLGPFLILLYLFRATRGYVESWIGKLVALTVLGVSASIVLRLVLAVLNGRMRGIQATIPSGNAEISIAELLANAAGVTGAFWICTFLMIALPSAIAIGSSVGAGVAMAGGMVGGAGATGVLAAKRVGMANVKLAETLAKISTKLSEKP